MIAVAVAAAAATKSPTAAAPSPDSWWAAAGIAVASAASFMIVVVGLLMTVVATGTAGESDAAGLEVTGSSTAVVGCATKTQLEACGLSHSEGPTNAWASKAGASSKPMATAAADERALPFAASGPADGEAPNPAENGGASGAGKA
jgi:hypothetical protein